MGNQTIAEIMTNGNQKVILYDFEQRKIQRINEFMDLETAKENLLIFKSVLDRYKIKFWLFFGTLLGAVRDGNFIPYDTDVDVGAFLKDKDKLIEAISVLEDYGFKLIRTNRRDTLITIMRKDEYIDIYLYKKIKTFFGVFWMHELYKWEYLILKNKHLKKFDRITFCDDRFLIPFKSEEILEKGYGKDWKILYRSSNYNIQIPWSFKIMTFPLEMMKVFYLKLFKS